MKKFYIIDENGKYASEDGKTRFTCLTGSALYDYLQTEEGSKKEFYIDKDDNGDEIGVEVPADRIKEFKSEKNRADYVISVGKEIGFVFVSLNADYEGKDGECMTYEEIVASDDEDIMTQLAKEADFDTLRKALATLSTDEMDIIFSLYLSDTPLTESELAAQKGVSQQAISKRKSKIFEKIRNFFEK